VDDILSRRLATALRMISVSPDRRSAVVGTRVVSADDVTLLGPLLTEAIYDEFHAGRMRQTILPGGSLRDHAIEERLRDLMPYGETARETEVIEARATEILVRLDGIRVWVPRSCLCEQAVPTGRHAFVRVRLPACRPALSTGFFLADSATAWTPSQARLRVYVHLRNMTGALLAWAALLRMLADLEIGYCMKVASSESVVPRRDGLVLYVDQDHCEIPRRVAGVVASLPGIGSDTSVFATPVAPGVATACEPVDARPGMRGMSFGEHRAAVLAEAVLAHAAKRTSGSADSLTSAVLDAFAAAAIDPSNPAENLNLTGSDGGAACPDLDRDPQVRR
jgi:hypothetical protein